jgi:hypothetical protein
VRVEVTHQHGSERDGRDRFVQKLQPTGAHLAKAIWRRIPTDQECRNIGANSAPKVSDQLNSRSSIGQAVVGDDEIRWLSIA